jgi:carboxypeptidase C (cathepsin A)
MIIALPVRRLSRLGLALVALSAWSIARADDPPPAEKPGAAAPSGQKSGAAGRRATDAADTPAAEQHRLPPDATTKHTLDLPGRSLAFTATAGSIRLFDEKGEPQADIAYTSYQLDGADHANRPVTFLFNGGPGAASAYLQLGNSGPWRLPINADAVTPSASPDLQPNAETWLDFTDLVFIDPVGTGFSHAVGKAKNKDFWGVDQDVHSLAQFIVTYVSRSNRWNSAKFLIGESYGTFRSAALGNYLQSHDNMAFNGIVLISSVLDLGTISFNPGEDMPYVFYLPSYAATAWYHKMLKSPPADLNAFLGEARKFAATDYAAALMKGSALTDAERTAIAKQLSEFTGLDEDYLKKANLRVTLRQFMVELQRSKGLTTGRLDSRFTGPTYDLLSEFAESDPQSDAVSSAFTAAFNSYVREDLKYSQDRRYEVLGFEVGRGWDWKHQRQGFGFPGSPNVEGDLIEVLVANPHLRVEVENGIYDLATPFFETEYTMDHLGLPANLQKNIGLKYYDAGHMMYVRDEDLAKLKGNVAAFIDAAARK